MALVNDYKQVKEVYNDVVKRGITLPAFCEEDRETLEAILAAAYELGQATDDAGICKQRPISRYGVDAF